MNLLATGSAVAILQALKLVLLIPPTVDGEALYLESENPSGARTLVDLAPLEVAGVLSKVDLSDSEIDLVVELVRTVDDGEAEVIAVGLMRNLAIATDDRKARRVAWQHGGNLLSTPDLLLDWQRTDAIPDDEMAKILALVSQRSRYRPPRAHPLHEWWMGLLMLNEAHCDTS
jgi:predicted nucleic acid-binding protein